MTRLDPNRELDTFTSRVKESHRRYIDLYNAVSGSANATDLRRGLATDAAFRLGSEWESFQHRWHIAAIATDPKRLIESQTKTLNAKIESLPKGTRDVFGVNVTHSRKTSLTRVEIESLVDQDGRNITFKDAADWGKVSASVLVGACHQRVSAVSGDAVQASLIDLLKALRNAIAHSSDNSIKLLNLSVRPRADDIGLTGDANTPFVLSKYSAGNVGKYLHSWTHEKQADRLKAEGTRASLLHRRMLAISKNLRL